MNRNTTFYQAKRKAQTLLRTLREKANAKPEIFCENYGQTEVRAFKDDLENTNLHYTEKCDVMEILYRISSFSPST